jgi:hypothetical protein
VERIAGFLSASEVGGCVLYEHIYPEFDIESQAKKGFQGEEVVSVQVDA